MPWPPAHVTPGALDGLSANPWIHVRDTASTETEAGASKAILIKASSSRHHSRSHTTIGDPLCSPSASSDDFQDTIGRRGASLDLQETRPSLKRAISRSRKTFEGERLVDINGGKETSQTETEVIIHQIQPGDSLPGVALKYNVSLATLRSANKLWTNDTIHLRQVLYIPIRAITIGKAKKSISNSAEARSEHPSHLLHCAPEVHIRTFPHMRRNPSDWNTNFDPETTVLQSSSVRTISAGSTSIIQRVPLSELSFFPPPSSTSALSSATHTPLRGKHLSHKSNNTGTPSPSIPSPSIRVAPAFGLANLWNGAKEEIISRLSFDSTRGSSDASEEHDLELDVVGPRRRVRYRGRSIDSDREQEFIPQSEGTAIAMHSITGQDGVILNTPRKPKVVRTIQLQPSPKMVIPASS